MLAELRKVTGPVVARRPVRSAETSPMVTAPVFARVRPPAPVAWASMFATAVSIPFAPKPMAPAVTPSFVAVTLTV